jgi:hypothetical protein
MKVYGKMFVMYCLAILMLIYPINVMGIDVYGPKPFNQIAESDLTETWSPSSVNAIQNREHVLFVDITETYCLTVSSDLSSLGVGDVSALTGGTGTYGNAMRSMFQILDMNTAELATEDLAGTYTIHPWLASYHAIDADADIASESASSIVIRDKNSFYIEDQSTIAFLVFTITGTPSSTTVQATSRYFYNTSLDSAIYEQDTEWSADQWIKMDANSVSLTSNVSEATAFMLADANDLLDVSVPEGSDLNPAATEWQTNSFAAYPENVWDYDDSELNSDLFLQRVDDYYETQFGDSEEASAAASDALDAIEISLTNQSDTLRYSKSVYLTFRESLLSYEFGAVDMYNSVLGEATVENVYFTNAADDDGVYHPFMVIASHNAPAGPQFLIDVARPPGDACCEGGYAEQNVTRNAVLEVKLVKIPLTDYGLVSIFTDNDLSSYGTLAEDEGLTEEDWTIDNYTSLSSTGIAVDGVMIYPASNNVLVYATYAAEVTESGIHVGRGMGFHYHADGHSFNGNGINLYNLSDYDGHTHPPIIGFVFDGIALFGKYESTYVMEGDGDVLDDYNGHTHDDYGYHYHAFSTEVTQTDGPDEYTYDQHFFQRGAFKGLVNDIPGLFQVSTSQLMEDDYKRYVGGEGTVVVGTDNTASNQIPEFISISQNYPNPFNPVTAFHYDLPEDALVNITIYDMMGRIVNNLVSSQQNAGYKSIQWNATNNAGQPVSAGVYLYTIQVGEFKQTKKLVLLK